MVLEGVLMLVVWFALPVLDEVVAEYVLYTLADFGLCTIADQLIHGTTLPDVVLQSIDKLLVGFHPVGLM